MSTGEPDDVPEPELAEEPDLAEESDSVQADSVQGGEEQCEVGIRVLQSSDTFLSINCRFQVFHPRPCLWF